MAQGGYPGNFAAEGNLKKAMGRAEFDGDESPDTAWKKIQGYKEGTIAVSMDTSSKPTPEMSVTGARASESVALNSTIVFFSSRI